MGIPSHLGTCEPLQSDARFDVCHWFPGVATSLAEGSAAVEYADRKYVVGGSLRHALADTRSLPPLPVRDIRTGIALIPRSCHSNMAKCGDALPLEHEAVRQARAAYAADPMHRNQFTPVSVAIGAALHSPGAPVHPVEWSRTAD
jgi:hypothetical protein